MSSVGSSSSRDVVAPGSALEHYERAAEKESEGKLGESLRLYRKAFRVNSRSGERGGGVGIAGLRKLLNYRM